ncbi:hypothetical protein POM88_043451 [Heracleum sosnowskyi]|uniref:MOSC domain-containing protein n=1 Tax=Heracleum sosnowskyi TaxID=360622 RepID=A0AAD8H3K3_9APIA|nr:hypothetical protein POM88_043451 [Heracleum sosnowskyi]
MSSPLHQLLSPVLEYNSRPLPVYAPTPGYNLVFTDQYQFLMLSQGSLDALNNQLEEPLPVNRFRPSIFIDGCEPFAEDLWKEIKINNITFISIQLCPRCKVKYSTHWPSCFVLYTLNQAHFALGILCPPISKGILTYASSASYMCAENRKALTRPDRLDF